MSTSKLHSAINVLQQSPNSKELLKALISIRNEVDWVRNKQNVVKLREKGCLRQITAILLSCSQKNCVDLSLSILGNCLMDRACTSEVVAQHNVISTLNQLVKKYPKEDSFNGRTFRIIGNMCQHRDQWANVIIDRKPQIIIHIIHVVKRASADKLEEGEKISEATVIMGLRALRELLNSHTVMSLVKFGALRAIGALFIKYSVQWQKNKDNEKVLLDILRVILEYSRFKHYPSILEMRNTEKGDSLVHLSKVLLLAPRRIVKIVMNFIRNCQLQSEIPIPEICEQFVNVLDKHSVLKEFGGHYSEYLQCLCYLLDHPANRSQGRCDKVISLLIKVLKEFEQPSNTVMHCCDLLINTLNKFKYSDKLMLEQLKHGVIQVLVDKLSWIVGPPNSLNLIHPRENKRKYNHGVTDYVPNKIFRRVSDDTLKVCSNSPSSSDDDYDILGNRSLTLRSPSPCSSSDNDTLSWSGPSSSCTKLESVVIDLDSDQYSPVCSETEELDYPIPHDDDLPDALPPYPDFDEDVENNDEDDKNSNSKDILMSVKYGLGVEIIKLLKSYIRLLSPHPDLASVDLLMQLTKCSITEFYDAKDVICEIIKTHNYLIPLMMSSYIPTLDEIRTIPPNHESCAKCAVFGKFTSKIFEKFSETAQGGAGKGDIAYQLLRGEVEARNKLVVVIPYIIRNRSISKKLMLNCGGLNVLMNLLYENNEASNKTDWQRALKALCHLASRCLMIANPRTLTPNKRLPVFVADQYQLSKDCGNVVTFEFDDGTTVHADREFLIEKSDYFSSLLNGHFKESGQDQVTLSKVQPKSFRCMLHLLKHIERKKAVEIDLDLETLLDVIMLCDRYLLGDLCLYLTDTVEQHRITTDTVPVIYNWSVGSGTNFLRVETVAYAIVASVDDVERYVMFENLFKLGYKKQLLEDIQNLLVRYLALGDVNHRQWQVEGGRKGFRSSLPV